MATMTTPLPDPYKVLGVDSVADANTIKKAYRKLVLSCHPDKVTDEKLKAEKQEEFHQIQQAYETVGDPDNRTKYDFELKAKKLREDRDRAASKGSPTHARHVNVNIFTARPAPEFRSKHSPSKPTQKPYASGDRERDFSRSWEHGIPTRSRTYEEEGRKTRRTMSDEKLKRDRDESRERDRAARRRADDEREKRRQRDEENDRNRRKREREQREREAIRKEAERQERKEREDRESRAKRRAERAAEKERAERERDRQRRDLEEKLKAKSKAYVEPYSEDEEDARRSRPKKPSRKESSMRDKSASKLRERSSPREEAVPEMPTDDKLQSTMAYAAQYIKKQSQPKHTPDAQFSSAEYPDPNNLSFKRRASADAKIPKAEAVDADSPPATSPTAHGPPPRLQKSYTMGQVPTVADSAPPPMRVPLGRSHTMDPDYLSRMTTGGSADKPHRSSRGRTSMDDDDYHFSRPRVQKYKVSGTDKGTPRVVESEYKDLYPRGPSAPFAKVKTSQTYGPEDVSASRSYRDELLTSEYGQPSYSQYNRSQAYVAAHM